jgi:hypothetical protein
MKKIALVLSLVIMFGFAVTGVYAQDATGATAGSTVTGSESTAVIICMQNAVGTRDLAISTALDNYATAAKAAITARTTALKTAWAITAKKDRRTALLAAWTTYKKAVQTARSAFKTARQTAWTTFATSAKACKPTKTQDLTNQAVDGNL